MVNTGLYEVLDVEVDATPAQIKAAHRRLALKYHPDKNPDDPSAEDRFKQVQHAYEVLSDTDKRTAYDRFGQQGVDALDNEFASPFVHVVGGHMAIFGALVLLLLVSAGSLMFLAGTAARLDGANAWSWVHSFFGVWMMDAVFGILALLHLAAFVSAAREKQGHAMLMMFSIMAVFGLFIAWTVLGAKNLDRSPLSADHKTWLSTNVPGIACFGIVFLAGCEVVRHSIAPEAHAFAMPRWYAGLLVAVRVLSFACPVVQLVLVSLKADAYYATPPGAMADRSWFVILLPAFLFTVFRGVSATGGSLIMSCRGIPEWKGVLCKEVFAWMLAHLLYLVGVGLVAEKLEHPLETSRTWGVTLVPWFLIFSFMTLLSCCFSCSFLGAMQMQQDQDENGGGQWVGGMRNPGQQQQQTEPHPAGGAGTRASATSMPEQQQQQQQQRARAANQDEHADESTPAIILGGPPSYGSNDNVPAES